MKRSDWILRSGVLLSAAAVICGLLSGGDLLEKAALTAVGLTERGSGRITVAASSGRAAFGGGEDFGEGDEQSLPTEITTTVTVSGPVAGKVIETLLPIGTVTADGVAIRNRSGVDLDVGRFLSEALTFSLEKTDAPQVLLYHTHTTESYMPYFNGTYRKGEAARTKNEAENVCAVGEVIADELRAAGIAVLHDTTVHDSPAYTGAYARSEQTALKILKEYPSIAVALDIHRDGVMINDTDKAKPTVTVNGRKAAQLMIICGTVSTKQNPSPHWEDNFRLALRLQKDLTADYGKLMRQMSVVSSRYNQHLAKACLLVEVGSEGNTMEEAKYTAALFGRSLAGILTDLQK